VIELKIPTPLQLSIAASHARENLRKKINALCTCNDCKYVQIFTLQQMQAQMQNQCGSCGGESEEE